MNWQEADRELDQRVKNFRYQNPKLSYQEAVNIILEDDVELAAAYNNMDSPRTANIKRQFELEKKLKKYPNDPAADIFQYQYRITAAQYLGWRSASKTYGIDVEKEIIEKIKHQIINLENKQTAHSLPEIEAELSVLRKKLDKIEKGKKFSLQNRYPSPSAELSGRAKKKAMEYGIKYENAVDLILKEDLVLSTAHNLYDVDTLLGLKE